MGFSWRRGYVFRTGWRPEASSPWPQTASGLTEPSRSAESRQPGCRACSRTWRISDTRRRTPACNASTTTSAADASGSHGPARMVRAVSLHQAWVGTDPMRQTTVSAIFPIERDCFACVPRSDCMVRLFCPFVVELVVVLAFYWLHLSG